MKRVRKWLIRIGLGLLVLLIILTAVVAWVVRRAWPETSGTLQVSGLSAPVEISRDRWGVPQFYAQGYVHAQDRLWQMEMNRRLGSGTLGEVLGRLGGRIDRTWRLYGLRRV